MMKRRGIGKRVAAGVLAVMLALGTTPADLSGVLAENANAQDEIETYSGTEDGLKIMYTTDTKEEESFSSTIFGANSGSITSEFKLSTNEFIKLIKADGETDLSYLTIHDAQHGLISKVDNVEKSFSFEVIVPGGTIGEFSIKGCCWGGGQATVTIDGNGVENFGENVSVTYSGNGVTEDATYSEAVLLHDGDSNDNNSPTVFKCNNASGQSVRMNIKIESAGGKQIYVHNVAYEVIDPNATQWASGKTGTVTIGDSTFSVASGNEGDAFVVKTESGSGKVEVSGKDKAVVWANLGGSTQSISGLVGVSNVSVDGNKVTLTYQDESTYPSSYVLEVRDLSKEAAPKQDGETVTYDLTDGSVLSELFTSSIASGTEIKSEDGNLILKSGGSLKYSSNDGATHGIVVNGTEGSADTVSVKVAGNATVSITGSSFAPAVTGISAAVESGTIYVSKTENNNGVIYTWSDGLDKVTTVNTSSQNPMTSTFRYEGEATTLTFTFTGDTSYVRRISVTNDEKVLEASGTYPDAVKTTPSVIEMNGGGSLEVKELGQTLKLIQSGGDKPGTSLIASMVSVFAFEATTDNNTLEADLVINSSGASDKNFAALGVIRPIGTDDAIADYKVVTSAFRKNSEVVMLYSKVGTSGTAEAMGKSDKIKLTADVETKLHFKVTKTDAGIVLYVSDEDGNESTYTSSYSSDNISSASDKVMFGLVLNNVTVSVTNMKYTSASGEVLYDQNAYYDPMGEAPVATSISGVSADDRSGITVTWNGSDAEFDGKYVLQVLKPGKDENDDAAWEEIAAELTEKTYFYAVAFDASGDYKFRVCGTLGNSNELNKRNRNSWVKSEAVTIAASLQKPTITLDYTSPKDSVTLSWTASAGATKYEVYRRSSDETEAKLLDENVTGTTYTDKTVDAETPYYYSVKALSDNNFSPVSDEAWTLPTDGHSGNYDEKIYINVTERSYNTVFTDKITIKGTAGAPGTMKVYVNDSEKKSADISAVGGTFEFDDIELSQGRNAVKLELSYGDGLKTVKTLNYVYLTNYDMVVDANYTGTDGEEGTYTVGSDTKNYGAPTYSTVSAAIAAADGNSKIIFVRNGDYNEKIKFTTPNVTLIGEDSEKTRIFYDVEGSAGISKEEARYAFSVMKDATGFTAENLTIENSYKYQGTKTAGYNGNESAEAFYSEAGDSMLIGVRLISYQDTLQVKNNAKSGQGYYFLRCYIAGNVDFMWGVNCKAVFDDCDLVFRSSSKDSGYYTAFGNQESNKDTDGVVYNNCRFTSESSFGGTGSKYYLGRPYKVASGEEPYVSSVAFVNCYMGSVLNKALGYSAWSGDELSTSEKEYTNTYYYEYGTYGAGYAVNINRRQISKEGADAINTKLGRESLISAADTLSGKYTGGSKSIESSGTVKNEANVSDSTEYTGYEGDDTGLAQYNMEGFATTSSVTGGGLLKENNANYYKVTTANEFMDALQTIYNKKSSSPSSVIEVAADLDLGYNMITTPTQYSTSVFASHNAALNSTLLKQTGVSKVYIKGLKNITIFSQNGNTIKHAAFIISGSSNIIIRNIEFDELWEWDEGDDNPDHEPGGYDVNDWDYMTIESGSSGVWVDHCTFYKAYDGVVDIKTNSSSSPVNITISWCKFMPGSKNNTFFNSQMAEMEQRYQDSTQASKYPYYKSLRDAGMTAQEVWDYAYGQKKTHLFGQSDSATENKNLNITLANNYYLNSMDRMPRVRYGTAHVYNCYMNSNYLLTARASLELKYGTEIASHIVSNGASSTCDAQVLLENCNLNGIINVLNSGNGSSPSGYINAINSYYSVLGTRYKLEAKVNNTENASDRTLKVTDAASFKAALGYSYVLRDASGIESTLLSQGGAGTVKMTVLQWEKTSYNDTVPTSYTGSVTDNDSQPTYVYDTSVGKDFTSGAGSDFSSVVAGGIGNNGNGGSVDNSGSGDGYISGGDDDSTSGSGSGSNGSSGSGSDSTSGSGSGSTGNDSGTLEVGGDSANTTPLGDILAADDIPGASIVSIDGVEFTKIGSYGNATKNVLQRISSDGQVDSGETIAQTTNELAQAIKQQMDDGYIDVSVFASENADVTADMINSIIESGGVLGIGIVGNDGTVKAVLTLDGSSLQTASTNFSLKITVDPQSSSVRTKVANLGIGMNSYTVIDFDFSGDLPGVFKVAVDVSDKFVDGTQLALYYNNEQAGRLENQYQVTTVNSGFAEFAINHCSEYVLMDVSAARNMITTNTLTAPKTGDTNHLVLWVTMMGIVAAAYFGFEACVADKKKANGR